MGKNIFLNKGEHDKKLVVNACNLVHMRGWGRTVGAGRTIARIKW
jgi:hypothetical protein